MEKLRILLADDHAILREGLVVLINGQPDMEVVAQAETGRQAVDMASASKPDVAVLDVSMPELSGVEVAERMRNEMPGLRVLALTRHAEQAYLRRLLHAGAAGYVLKKSAGETLIHAIRTVAAGGTYVEPMLANDLLQRVLAHGPARSRHDSDLSQREEEVLRSIAWGRSNKEIASQLQISTKTVESYKASALGKLRLHSRADIVRYAVARGWLAQDRAPE